MVVTFQVEDRQSCLSGSLERERRTGRIACPPLLRRGTPPAYDPTVTPLNVSTPVGLIDTFRILRECTTTDWP